MIVVTEPNDQTVEAREKKLEIKNVILDLLSWAVFDAFVDALPEPL